jgi:hypothetical protein
MTTVKAFDEMMTQFIGEIAHTFPDESPKVPVSCSDFMRTIAPWVTQMTARDDAFFCEENALAKALDLHTIWKRDDCSQATKQAIWQYLSSMYMIATTLSMFPAETLSAIEAAAESCAKKMKVGPNGQIDEATLMSGVNSMLQQMLAGGDNPLAALMGGAGPGAARPGPRKQVSGPSKKKKSR